jgi:hypothetical protein
MFESISILNPFVLLGLSLWELVWKGLALWRAAQRGQKAWYVAILIINSLGILPIIYLLVSREKKVTPEQ